MRIATSLLTLCLCSTALLTMSANSSKAVTTFFAATAMPYNKIKEHYAVTLESNSWLGYVTWNGYNDGSPNGHFSIRSSNLRSLGPGTFDCDLIANGCKAGLWDCSATSEGTTSNGSAWYAGCTEVWVTVSDDPGGGGQ